ncbi:MULTISPECIES: DedA family protein [unclassified Virgibacillus]|uniref:DedA family protein n=1 Tax=unclassified Virgibacillus TaxID=2620237 RepID=UPI0024DDFA6D|nr:DedA family protein [Virgibacillus sp. LDC-1]
MSVWYELIGQYGYIGIFSLLTLGIVGLPVPDEVLLAYLGYVTSIGTMNFSLTFIVALLGSICGISVSYLLGMKLGEPFIKKYGSRFFLSEKTIQRVNRLFHRYGPIVLIGSYFIPGIRHVAAYIGGISRYSFKRFALFGYMGAFLWVMLFLALGNGLGANWDIITSFMHKYMWGFIFFLMISLFIFSGFYIYRTFGGKNPPSQF